MFFRFLALAALFAILIYWFYVRIRPEDPANFEKLVQESFELRTRRALEQEPAHQKRQEVQKDIWTQNESRHFQIQSQGSDLTISQKKDKIEVIERLQNVRCHIQNEFTLTADEGIYTFPSHQFIAEKNCKLVQNQNWMNGERIQFDLIEETVSYENPQGHLASGPIDFSAKRLFWDKRANQLYLLDDVEICQPGAFTLLAYHGTVALEELKPTLIILEGNVRLISSRIQDKESFAVADTLTYNPVDKTLLFSAKKRVLFWQEGLTLSAFEVLIRQDQTVEGHGDVHFTFNLEEQNTIDEFFKQYL